MKKIKIAIVGFGNIGSFLFNELKNVFVVEKEHGDHNATSPNQIVYRNLWGRYNTIKT